MWLCKDCKITVQTRSQLLKHYRLMHGHFGRSNSFPCTHSNCPCRFKTWNPLHSHLSRSHTNTTACLATFNCHLCSCSNIVSEREYFCHIYKHLKNHETVRCMFENCSFHTNVYGTFKSHKNRKHNPYSLKDFKQGVIIESGAEISTDEFNENELPVEEENVEEENVDVSSNVEICTQGQDLSKIIERKFASILLKLENDFHVPSNAIDELLTDLRYLHSASVPISTQVFLETFQKHDLHVDQQVVQELFSSLSLHNPLLKSTSQDGPLAIAFKRMKYYRENFDVIDPVEYIVQSETNRSFQYVPILKLLQQLLNQKQIIRKVVDGHNEQHNRNGEIYRSFKDGQHFQHNEFLSDNELRLSVCLYIDDFELCNPLGTSRKKHKICAVYWILGNLPPGCHSSLSSIYLALLCKSDDVKTFGYQKLLELLVTDPITLEQQGVFVSHLGAFLKGTVQYVAADSLGAHSLAGFVESFSGEYFCRFCTATRTEIQTKEVKDGLFPLRSEEQHGVHLSGARAKGEHCFGVKNACPLAENLSFFKVTSGFPPDVAHDLLEGIVPVELAGCIEILLKKKYFTFDSLNKLIREFPFKWGDKTNRPHVLPLTFVRNKTIGGNAHENWCLLRLLPLIVGKLVPQYEPAWEVILLLKDIVELAVCPVHTNESVAYFESKISEHRNQYQVLFRKKAFAKASFSGTLSRNDSSVWSTCLGVDYEI